MYTYVRNQPTNLIDAIGIYGQATHEDLTAMLARHAGYPIELATRLGRSNQEVDEKWPAEIMPLKRRTHSRRYHFTTEKQRQSLKAKALGSCDPCDVGKFLHALQDSYAHEGYGPQFGHISDLDVDYMAHDDRKAYRMALATYVHLGLFRKQCCGKDQWKNFGEPRKWQSIVGEVREAIVRDQPPGPRTDDPLYFHAHGL